MEDFREQGQQYAQLDVKVETTTPEATAKTVAPPTVDTSGSRWIIPLCCELIDVS
jgi:hypothetical protein